MAKDTWAGIPTHPGRASTPGAWRSQYVHPAQEQDAYFPANLVALGAETIALLDMNFVSFYNNNWATEVKDGVGSDIQPNAAGILFSNSTNANDDDVARSIRANALAEGKIHYAIAMLKLTDADTTGLWMGFVTSSVTEIRSANPADGVFLFSATNSAAVTGRTVENSTGANDVSLTTLTDNVSVEFGIIFKASTTDALNWGAWYVNGSVVPFTAAQLTDLKNMITTSPPTLAFLIGTASGGMSTGNLVVEYAWAGVDR